MNTPVEAGESRELSRIPVSDNTEQHTAAATASTTSLASRRGAIAYPQGYVLFSTYGALLLSTFMIGYDSNSIATVIPAVTDEFNSLSDVGWYGTAYLITSASTIISYGKIYKYYPAKPVYLTSLVIYLIGSAICTTAPSSLAFIIGRSIAGLGSAGLVAGSKILVTRILPLHRRPKYQGCLGGVESLAIAIGPLIGGAITTASSWRAIFYLSISIGVLNGLGVLTFGEISTTDNSSCQISGSRLKELDLPGLGLFVPAIVCLVLALTWGGAEYAWSNFRVILPMTLFWFLIVAFSLLQFYKKDAATLPPRIIGQRSILSASAFSFCNSAALFVLSYYLPIFFQAVKGVDTFTSGIMILPLIAGLLLAGVCAGYVTTWIGYYTPSMILSSILTSIGCGILSTQDATSDLAISITGQLVTGIGCGLGFQQPYVAAQTVVDSVDVPTALVVVGFSQRLGNIVALGVAYNVFSSHLLSNTQRLAPQVDPQLVLNAGVTSLRTKIPEAYQSGVVEAYSQSLKQVFYISVALCCLGMVGAVACEWKSVKKR